MGAIATHAAVDDHAAAAVREGHIANAAANDTAGIFFGSVDSAGGVEVLDGGAIDVAERSHSVMAVWSVAAALVEGQRVTLPIEGASELVGACASHSRDGDVSIKLHGLATETLAIANGIAEHVPAHCGFDRVLRTCGICGKLIGVGAEGDGDVYDVLSRGNSHCGRFGIHVVTGTHHTVAVVREDHTLYEVFVRRIGGYGERRVLCSFKDF